MTVKLLAISALAGMVIIGAEALASAAPNPQSGSYMTDSTTSMTSTTSNAPSYPGRMPY
jgi:hypothetical protein